MSNRKNEIFEFWITVFGFGPSQGRVKKGEAPRVVSTKYRLDSAVLTSGLDKILSEHKTLKESIIKLDEKVSGKYQMMGIEAINKKTIKCDVKDKAGTKKVSYDVYHVAFGCIFRDKEELKKIEIEKYVPQSITLEDKEYQYITLHASFIPLATESILVAENKCHNGPMAFVMQSKIAKFLKYKDYGLDDQKTLKEKTRFGIKQKIKEEFLAILEKQQKKMTEFSFTMGRPNVVELKNMTAEKLKENQNSTFDLVGDVLTYFADKDIAKKEFEKNPFKRLKITISLDDSYETKALNQLKSNAKNAVKDIVENVYFRESTVKFKNTLEEELESISLRGLGSTKVIDLKPSEYSDSEKMWKAQAKFFKEQKEKSK